MDHPSSQSEHQHIQQSESERRIELEVIGQLDEPDKKYLGDLLLIQEPALGAHSQEVKKELPEKIIKEVHAMALPTKAQKYACDTVRAVQQRIARGIVVIADESLDVTPLITIPTQLAEEEKKIDPEEHRKLMRHLKQLRLQHRNRVLQREQERLRREQQAQQLQRQQEERQRERVLDEKREKAKRGIADIQLAKKKRDELEQEANKQIAKLLKSRPLEEMNEQKYQKLVVQPQLQQEHELLEQLSRAKKSIGLKEIQQHERAIQEAREKLASSKKHEDWAYKPPSFRSNKYEIVKEENHKLEVARQEERKKQHQAIEANKKKLQELFSERLKTIKLKRQAKSERTSERDMSAQDRFEQTEGIVRRIREKGNDYLKFSKELVHRRRASETKVQRLSSNNPELDTISEKRVLPTLSKTPTPVKTSTQHFQSQREGRIDDLYKIRKDHIINIAHDPRRSQTEKNRLLKLELGNMQANAERIDELASQKEFLLKQVKPVNVDIDEAIGIVMTSVQTKLALLGLSRKSPKKRKTQSTALVSASNQQPIEAQTPD